MLHEKREDVAWIAAVSERVYTVGNYFFEFTNQTINHDLTNVDFKERFNKASGVFATPNTFLGDDHVVIRRTAMSNSFSLY